MAMTENCILVVLIGVGVSGKEDRKVTRFKSEKKESAGDGQVRKLVARRENNTRRDELR